MKNRIAYLVILKTQEGETDSYLYTDSRIIKKLYKDKIYSSIYHYEFRHTYANHWDEVYHYVNGEYINIPVFKTNTEYFSEEYLNVLSLLNEANWYSSIEPPYSRFIDCEECGKSIWIDDGDICSLCENFVCDDCHSVDYYNMDYKICDSCKYEECDGCEQDCENRLCYNDDCDNWNPRDYDGQTKSEYDENREFIMNLDPDDPADAWYFED